jgi:predicted RNA methylase
VQGVFRPVATGLRLAATGDWSALTVSARNRLLGIDLGEVTARELGLAEDSRDHNASQERTLVKLLRQLPITPQDGIVDLGCGKGAALIAFRQLPFSRITGVELSPELAEICRKNLRRLRHNTTQVVCADAREFRDLGAYTYAYLFNPFGETVLEPVLENLTASLRRAPRPFTLLYYNPVHAALLTRHGFTAERTFQQPGGHPTIAYRYVAASGG